MDDITRSITSSMILGSLIMLCLFSGCSTPPKALGAKESRMSEELLRSQVLRYKAEVEAGIRNDMFNQIISELHGGYYTDAPFTPEVLTALQEKYMEMYETMFQWSDSYVNYRLFYDKLKQRGGDMTGLELEIEPFIPQ